MNKGMSLRLKGCSAKQPDTNSWTSMNQWCVIFFMHENSVKFHGSINIWTMQNSLVCFWSHYFNVKGENSLVHSRTGATSTIQYAAYKQPKEFRSCLYSTTYQSDLPPSGRSFHYLLAKSTLHETVRGSTHNRQHAHWFWRGTKVHKTSQVCMYIVW